MSNIEESVFIAAINEDEELKAKIRSLAWKVVEKTEYIIEHGNSSLQVQAIKNIMPAIVKALSQQGEDEKFIKMRQDFEEQMHAMREAMGLNFGTPVDD